MGHYLYQLVFDGPVHFGDTSLGGGLEQAGWEYPADRLFSSLCVELASQGETALLEELVKLAQAGDFSLSDLLPYQLGEGEDLELFLPVPYIYKDSNQSRKRLAFEAAKELSAQRKKMKKQAYCRASELGEYCQAIKAERLFLPSSVLDLGTEELAEKVNCRGEQPLPYYVKGNVFRQGVGLYLLVNMPEEWEAQFADILTSLGMSGIGGKRSSGYGRFHLGDDSLLVEEAEGMYVDLDALVEMLQAETDCYMNIASLWPAAAEIPALADGMYRLRKSSGFTAGAKRDSVYMLSAGSCVSSRLSGRLASVGMAEGHPIWRYGLGMYVGIDL